MALGVGKSNIVDAMDTGTMRQQDKAVNTLAIFPEQHGASSAISMSMKK